MARRAARITLLWRPGCHLCDDARAVTDGRPPTSASAGRNAHPTRSTDDLGEHWEEIPATLVDGVQIDFWLVSEPRLRAALG